MTGFLKAFVLAVQFLTRLPTPRLNHINEKDFGRSQYFYPLTGLVIGLLLTSLAVASQALLSPSALSSLVIAAMILTGWILITGALHLDGLADSADAWVGGHTDREKTLAIMKDPRSGPVAVSIVVIVILLKLSLLAALVEQQQLVALILSPVIARLMAIVLLHYSPYCVPGGIAEPLTQRKSTGLLWANIGLIAIGLLIITGTKALIISLLAVLTMLLIRHLAMKRLGGVTGDIAGTVIELVEVSVLFALLVN